MIEVRDYRENDFATLVEMGRRFHQESDFARFEFDPAFLLRIHQAVLLEDDWLCCVAEDRDVIVGMFVGVVQPFWFGPSRHAIDLCLFVDRTRRGSFAAVRLLTYARAWAKARGALQLRFGAATGIDPNRSDRFFKGLGFETAGVLYTMDP